MFNPPQGAARQQTTNRLWVGGRGRGNPSPPSLSILFSLPPLPPKTTWLTGNESLWRLQENWLGKVGGRERHKKQYILLP